MDVTTHTPRRAELVARRKALLDRLAATLAELPDALAKEADGSRRAVLYARMAGDFEAAYVEQAWELLEGKPPLLASFRVAQRKVRAAGIAAESDGGRLLASILRGRATATESARLLRTSTPSTDPECQAAEAAAIATIFQGFAQVTAILAGRFGDADLRAKAIELDELAAGVADRHDVDPGAG